MEINEGHDMECNRCQSVGGHRTWCDLYPYNWAKEEDDTLLFLTDY